MLTCLSVNRMIKENSDLFSDSQCKVCSAVLISESQKLAHYQVRFYSFEFISTPPSFVLYPDAVLGAKYWFEVFQASFYNGKLAYFLYYDCSMYALNTLMSCWIWSDLHYTVGHIVLGCTIKHTALIGSFIKGIVNPKWKSLSLFANPLCFFICTKENILKKSENL